jgi:hypothetical protein
VAKLFERPAKSQEPRKQIRLKLRTIDIWSATKAGFFVALAAAIGIVVSALLLWLLLTNSGALASVGGLLSSVLGDGSGFNLEREFSFGNVMGTALTLSLLNVVLTTSLAAVYAAIFNLIAKLIGGISLTFTNN